MCGFTVCIRASGLSESDRLAVHGSNAAMKYRGPDEQGVWEDECVAMGHVRLSIIGVDNGKQPIFSQDRKLVLVCNGEIYNHRSLRAKLESNGAVFSTESDCEVIVHAYEQYGDDFIRHLDGMFAFVLYDVSGNRIIAARDHAGKKPIYYQDGGDFVVVSSELKAIRDRFLEVPDVNFEVVRQTQKNRYSLSETETYIENIKKIPGGGYLSFPIGGPVSVGRWHQRRIASRFDGDYNSAVRRTQELLFEAVEKRLESEVPLALLLSAGIDSSAIACIAGKLGHKIRTFSAGYAKRSATDESWEAEKLAGQLGLPFERVVIDERDFVGSLGEILPHLDEPNGDPSMFSQWALYKAVSARGYRVLLSGIGGDELFFGYPPINASGLRDAPGKRESRPARLAKSLVEIGARSPAEAIELVSYLVQKAAYTGTLASRDYSREVEEVIGNRPEAQVSMSHTQDDGLVHEIDRVYSALYKIYLPNNGFFLADRLAMAHSIEIRCPFADIRLLEFVDGLPLEFKFPRGEAKGLLKDALRGVVPDHVLDRRKTGFTPPSTCVLAAVAKYKPRHFASRQSSLAQVATDHAWAAATARVA